MSDREPPRTPTLAEVDAGSERALQRVESWPEWKRALSSGKSIRKPAADELTAEDYARAAEVLREKADEMGRMGFPRIRDADLKAAERFRKARDLKSRAGGES